MSKKRRCSRCVEAFMESIKDSLTSNKNVYLRGFGSFIVKRRAEKVARNIFEKHDYYDPCPQHPGVRDRAKSFAGKVKANAK